MDRSGTLWIFKLKPSGPFWHTLGLAQFSQPKSYGVIWHTLRRVSSVKWGHLANFESNSLNTIFSAKILWGHLAHFEPDPNFHSYWCLKSNCYKKIIFKGVCNYCY